MSEAGPDWDMEAYRYDLPPDRIAQHPLQQRDSSRLLVVDALTSAITHTHFSELLSVLKDLPQKPHLVFNQTKVVAARLPLFKPSGGAVEILLNEPVAPFTDPQLVLASRDPSDWGCLIGGRNVTAGMVLHDETNSFRAEVLERNRMNAVVRLSWDAAEPLLSVLERLGHVPLPPYINRADDSTDKERYQTVFAQNEGSVAAPTAGLHFTKALLHNLETHGVSHSSVTLHVGMGTFKPVEVQHAQDHVMHAERVTITRTEVEQLYDAVNQNKLILPVGTTSMRSVESLYWLGLQIIEGQQPDAASIVVPQFAAMTTMPNMPSATEALHALVQWMDKQGQDKLDFRTQLMIAPGAIIGIVGGLITNFHQPGSTLLLLVAAILGPQWISVYQEALMKGYRFLSYGDAMLITRSQGGSEATT